MNCIILMMHGLCTLLEIIGENRTWSHDLYAEDVRIMAHNYELFVYYNFHMYKKTFFYCKIHHDVQSNELYAYNKYNQVYFQKEDQVRHEKNWVAFEYCPHCIFERGVLSTKKFQAYMEEHPEEKELLKDVRNFYPEQEKQPFTAKHDFQKIQSTQLFYIYSTVPFIVVKIYPTEVWGVELAELAFVSEILNNPWQWGDIRGGSQAIPIDDDHYLTFFHTRCVVSHHAITTYLMGAYLFSR